MITTQEYQQACLLTDKETRISQENSGHILADMVSTLSRFEDMKRHYRAHPSDYPDASPLTYLLLGMAERLGELAEKVKDGKTRTELELEAGDILWCLTVFCHRIGSSLEEVMTANATKLIDRHARGVIHGKGDLR